MIKTTSDLTPAIHLFVMQASVRIEPETPHVDGLLWVDPADGVVQFISKCPAGCVNKVTSR